jgi:hypothetical protein
MEGQLGNSKILECLFAASELDSPKSPIHDLTDHGSRLPRRSLASVGERALLSGQERMSGGYACANDAVRCEKGKDAPPDHEVFLHSNNDDKGHGYGTTWTTCMAGWPVETFERGCSQCYSDGIAAGA